MWSSVDLHVEAMVLAGADQVLRALGAGHRSVDDPDECLGVLASISRGDAAGRDRRLDLGNDVRLHVVGEDVRTRDRDARGEWQAVDAVLAGVALRDVRGGDALRRRACDDLARRRDARIDACLTGQASVAVRALRALRTEAAGGAAKPGGALGAGCS